MKEPIFSPLSEPCRSEILPNGLAVSVFQKTEFGKSCAVLAVRFGEGDLQYDLDGCRRQVPTHMAFFMSHFLRHQAETLLRETVPGSDACVDVNATEDMTVFYLECRIQFELCLSLLLKILTDPQFTQANLDEARVLAVQRVNTMKSAVSWQLQWQLQEGLYGVQSISEEDFAEITVETFQRVHKAFYRASNFALCTAGAADPEQVFRLAAACIPAGDGKKLRHETTGSEANLDGGQERAIAMDVQETSFLLGFRTEVKHSVRQWLVGMLVMQSFAGEAGSLCRQLQKDRLLRSGLSAGLHMSTGKTYLTFGGCSPVPERIAEEIMSEAIRVSWQGLDRMDFTRAKRTIYGKGIMKLDDFRELCLLQVKYHLFDFPWMSFPEVLEKIKKDEVEEMLRESIADSKSFLSVVHPKGVY